MHKERILPWQKKGRWYEFFVESNGTEISLTRSSLEGADIATTYLNFPTGFHVVDFVIDNDSDATSATDYSKNKRLLTSNRQGIKFPAAGNFTYAYVYVFGYFE